MPIKDIQFGASLPQAQDPVSANGGLLVQAGQMTGQAAQARATGESIFTKTAGQLLETAGNAGLAAYKGSLESDMEADIRKTIDGYRNTVNLDNAVASLDILRSDVSSESTPAAVKEAMAKIDKYKSAITQGTMSREQALLSIDSTVKDYSNRMPGWASDFRKQAAQVTGVDHMGNYAEFALLGKQSMAEERAKALTAAHDKLRNDFISTYGRMPTGQADMAMFAEQKTIQAQAARAKAQTEIRDASITQLEPAVTNYINLKMADGVMTLNTRLQGIVNATSPDGKPIPPESKLVLRQRVVSDINGFFQAMQGEVLGFNANQISNATREQQLNRLNSQRTAMIDALTNQDTFDDFKKTMELQGVQAKNIMDKFWLANAHLKPMKDAGIMTPDLVKLWIDSQADPARMADFNKRYPLVNELLKKSMSGNSDQYQNNYRLGTTDPDHLEALRKTDVGQYQINMHGLSTSIKTTASEGWGETPTTQETRKANFATWLNTFASQVKPSDAGMVAQWNALVADPKIAQRIKELPEQQQALALQPIVKTSRDILESPEFGLFKKLGALVERNSTDTSRTNIVWDNLTQQFKAEVSTTTSGRLENLRPTRELASGAVVYEDTKKGSKTSPITTVIPATGEVATTIATINKTLSVLANMKDFKSIIPEDLAKRGVAKDYFNKFSAGYFSMSIDDRFNALSPNTPLSSKAQAKIDKEEARIPKLSDVQVKLDISSLQDALKTATDPLLIRVIRSEILSLEELLKPKKAPQ